METCDKTAPSGVFWVKAFNEREMTGMEQSTFLALAEQYKDTVFRIALNYYGNTYDADDTVQDVMIKLLRSDKVFENEEHARSWIIRVTVNQCKNTLRMARLRRHADLEDVDVPVQFQYPEQGDLYLEVMSLPERYRMPLYLFYYEELSVAEIAGILGLKPSAVTTRLSRARNHLKNKLTEVWQNEE